MRKLGLLTTLWTALLFFPLTSFALGLGEIEVDTYLNQPLKAKIEVLSARPGEVDDLLVSLASREAFRKAGLQRSSNLSKLRFKVEKSEDGQSALILITTKTPIKEPFLNFLVEADWAKGRLLREFTILLDPPYFAQQVEAAVTPASSEPEPALESRAPEQESITRMDDSTMPMEPETQQFEGEALSQPIALVDEPVAAEDTTRYVSDTYAPVERAGSDEILVEKGDTLWGIASRFKDSEHSMGQIMLAMQAMNPDAFGQDNINNLRVGSILRAPDMDALDRLSKQEAYAQVLEQNGLWDEYVARKSGATMAGSPGSTAMDAPSDEQLSEDSQLSLLAPGDGESTSASLQSDANTEDAGQIRKQLAFAEEELEASRLENDDLKSRVSDLEQQLAKFEELQKLVQIEDSSLAQLQSSVTEDQSQTDGFKEDVVQESESIAPQQEEAIAETEEELDRPTDVMKEAAGELMSESTDEQAVSEAPADEMRSETESGEQDVVESESTFAADGEGDLRSDTEMAADKQETSDEMAAVEGPQADQQEKQAEFVPAPVIVTEAPSTDLGSGILDMLPSLDSILSDPVMLGGIGAILALLLGLLFLKRKKSENEEESGLLLEEGDDLMDDDPTPIHVPSADDAAGSIEEDLGALDTEQHLADTLAVEADELREASDDDFSNTEVISAAEKPTPEEPAAAEEQDDVLNEVDVYLAYGLYDNAEDLLKESLQESPDRADYRAKLLDTYFATKNAAGFIHEAEALKSLGGAADRYWDRIQIMGFELAPDNELFADARNSDLSVADLEYEKPDSPDFDIGAEDDITDFSSTDFDLLADAGADDSFDVTSDLLGDVDREVTDTETIAPLGVTSENTDDLDEDIQLPDINDDEETLLREEEVSETDNLELPDQIGDFDLGLDDDDSRAEEQPDEDALNFNLPDDLDLSSEVDENLITSDLTDKIDSLEDMSEIDIESEMESSDVSELNLEEGGVPEDVEDSQTENKDQDDELGLDLDIDTEGDDQAASDSTVEGTKHYESALDMDMSDLDSADLHTGTFKVADTPTNDEITEFRPADITGEYSGYDELEESVEDVDVSAGLEKTGTYAPGDFNEDDIEGLNVSIDDADDIEDLMLPDDVDEVGTKLDLAKAFIDMGDAEGAKSSLEEVLSEGTEEQKVEATELMEKIK